MSTPYGPWDDDFTAAQHKDGPFREIHDYYVQSHGLDKKK
jgi:thiosulfate dehydrogenase